MLPCVFSIRIGRCGGNAEVLGVLNSDAETPMVFVEQFRGWADITRQGGRLGVISGDGHSS